jgi:hypothetical protein
MPDIPAVLVILEKGGVVAMLLLNSVIVYKFGIAGIRQILDGSWVPGRYYKDVCEDRDRLRAENDAYRSVTLRAVGVVERVAGS